METEKPKGLDMSKEEEPNTEIPTPSNIEHQIIEDVILHFQWQPTEPTLLFTELSLEKALKQPSFAFETQWLKVADIQTWDSQYSFMIIPPGKYRYNLRHREVNGNPGPIVSAEFDMLSPEQQHKTKTTTLQFFDFEPLPIHLQKIGEPLCVLADQMEDILEASPEKSAGMRKLLEARDCFVRCRLSK